jgi:hypothetical protein
MKTVFNLILICGLAFAARAVQAQDEVPPPMPDAPTFSDAQLDQLLGPIALYPDPLMAVLLPAATEPSQIVIADRYVQNGGDPNAIDQQGWDPNVQALAHYPDVLKWMDDNLNWTTQLGEAFQNQQQEVMDSVQRLRTQAYNLGNLASTPQQQVIDDGGNIEIIPSNPNNLYVPDYQPSQVYYQQPYGAPYITFSAGFIIGSWLCGDFDWHNHHLVVWDHDHPRPRNWWHEQPQQRAVYLSKQTSQTSVWHPQNRPALQPQGDRGWNNSASSFQWNNPNPNRAQGSHNFNVPNNRTQTAPVLNRPTPPPPVQRPPVNVQRPPENIQRPQNDTFIGIQNAQDARTFSNRGQQSMQTTHTEPPPRVNAGSSGGSVHSSGGSSGGANPRH